MWKKEFSHRIFTWKARKIRAKRLAMSLMPGKDGWEQAVAPQLGGGSAGCPRLIPSDLSGSWNSCNAIVIIIYYMFLSAIESVR